jgi:hypothetical protein
MLLLRKLIDGTSWIFFSTSDSLPCAALVLTSSAFSSFTSSSGVGFGAR